jgi:hypothetical protein
MFKRERENGNVSQVNSLLIKNALHFLIAFLGKQRSLRKRGGEQKLLQVVLMVLRFLWFSSLARDKRFFPPRIHLPKLFFLNIDK